MARAIGLTTSKSAEDSGVRVDAWLWAARFFKTRALARQAVERGRVELAGAPCKPAHAVKPGDRLRVRRGDELFELEVRALAAKRGSAARAQALYVESAASIAARATVRERTKAERAGYQPPARRPDKRARRLLRALGDFDAS
jgi:ribosome-associated heat shock protein Hsp15